MKAEEKMEEIGEQARKKAMEYLKSKCLDESDMSAMLLHRNQVPKSLEKEYWKKYDEFYRKIEQDDKKQSDEKKVEGSKEKKTIEKEKIAELTDTLQRLQAEFENYKKRVDKEKGEFVKYAKAELIQRLLPTLDTFEIALKSTKDNERFVKGMEMVYAQFVSTLQSDGLKPIEAIGKKFDPYLHEVMLKEKSDKDDEIVLEELQKGYMLNDKVLRHSKVKINSIGTRIQ